MMDSYDVVVVGGGPAGLCASRHAALEGCKTLLIEKKTHIDAPTICGEFIPTLEEARSLMPNTQELSDFYQFASSKTIANMTSILKAYTPSSNSHEFAFGGLVIEKNLVNAAMGQASAKAGVKVATSSRVASLEERDDHVRLHVIAPEGNQKMRAEIVVGADGFPSTVASHAGLPTGFSQNDLALCLNFLMEDVRTDENIVEMYFGNEAAPGGYVWIIPKRKGVANVGLGVRLSRLRCGKNLQERFDSFRQRHPIASQKLLRAKILRRSAKIVPVGGVAQRICGDRILLAGDSAGTVIPINGGGILTAAVSGRIAGQISSKIIRGESGVSTYQRAIEAEMGEELRRGLAYRKAADYVMMSDRLLDVSFRFLGKSNLANIVQCRKSYLNAVLRLVW